MDLSSGCSTKPPSDVGLRLSPRLKGSPCVVCSSLLQGSWTKEETLHQLPYKHGAPFETIILAQNDTFKVSPTQTSASRATSLEMLTYLFSPLGGSKRHSSAGIQAQNSIKQGGHTVFIWQHQRARHRLHPKLSSYDFALLFFLLNRSCALFSPNKPDLRYLNLSSLLGDPLRIR